MEIAALFFAGCTAVANLASAYSAYRANHPRRNHTGQITNYTAAHQGYSMAAASQPVPQYYHLIHAPVYYNVNYNQITYSNPPIRSQSQPNYRGQQQLTSGQRAPQRSNSQQIQPFGFGGTIILIIEQQAPDTFEDDGYGLSTGSRPGYSMMNAQNHWQSFRGGNSGYCGGVATVAVLNWTMGEITMFVMRNQTYFRNYKVHNANVARFAQMFRGNEVFSGIVEDGKLVGANRDLTIVEDDGDCGFASSNCWEELGIPAPGFQDPCFLEMVRGAVFGLICCVHSKPSNMNVDMVYGDGIDFVHVDTDMDYIESAPDSCFTVFSFLTRGWTTELVLVG